MDRNMFINRGLIFLSLVLFLTSQAQSAWAIYPTQSDPADIGLVKEYSSKTAKTGAVSSKESSADVKSGSVGESWDDTPLSASTSSSLTDNEKAISRETIAAHLKINVNDLAEVRFDACPAKFNEWHGGDIQCYSYIHVSTSAGKYYSGKLYGKTGESLMTNVPGVYLRETSESSTVSDKTVETKSERAAQPAQPEQSAPPEQPAQPGQPSQPDPTPQPNPPAPTPPQVPDFPTSEEQAALNKLTPGVTDFLGTTVNQDGTRAYLFNPSASNAWPGTVTFTVRNDVGTLKTFDVVYSEPTLYGNQIITVPIYVDQIDREIVITTTMRYELIFPNYNWQLIDIEETTSAPQPAPPAPAPPQPDPPAPQPPGPGPVTPTAPLIIDHRDTNIRALTTADIELAKNTLSIMYEGQSHAYQIVHGMEGLVGFANSGGLGLSHPQNTFNGLDLRFRPTGSTVHNMYLPSTWEQDTRAYLQANPGINVVMWEWCAQLMSYSAEQVQTEYIDRMERLEAEFPNVVFVYTTMHAGGGNQGVIRNNQIIRDYALANNKILYDFEDLDQWDPDGNYYGNMGIDGNGDYNGGNWAEQWGARHTEGVDWYTTNGPLGNTDWRGLHDTVLQHAHPVSYNQKAYAAWAMWVQIAKLITGQN